MKIIETFPLFSIRVAQRELTITGGTLNFRLTPHSSVTTSSASSPLTSNVGQSLLLSRCFILQLHAPRKHKAIVEYTVQFLFCPSLVEAGIISSY